MTIKEQKAQYVFEVLAKGIKVIAVDFKKEEYLDLSGLTVEYIRRLTSQSDTTKFFSIETTEVN